MDELTSHDDDYNVYLTEADFSTESTSRISPDDLLKNIKLFSLLGEHVVLAAAHIFESPQTYELLRSQPFLLETEIIVADLRDDCRDFTDFLEFQRTKKPHEALWHCAQTQEITDFLNAKCPRVLHWSPRAEEDLFRTLLVEALENRESTLRKRMIGIRNSSIDDAVARIGDAPRVTRSFLRCLAQELFPQRLRVLMEEVNAAYYLAGAKDMNLIPALHPDYFNKCKNGLEHVRNDRYCRELMRDMFANMLGTRGLRRDSVALLSVEGVHGVREDGIIKSFRDAWWNIVRSARGAEGLTAIQEYELEVVKRIQEKLREENKAESKFEKAEKAVGACSLAASGLSVLPNPILALISFALALISHPSATGKVKEKFVPGELSVLCARINEEVVRSLMAVGGSDDHG